MANEKFIVVLKQIKEIYVKLFFEEPTPDEEIEAKDKFVNLLQDLLDNISGFEDNQDLINKTLKIVEEWDTLDLWFKEVEGLHSNIEKIINIAEETKIEAGKTEDTPIKEEKSKEEPKVNIKEIVTQVSQEFKGEISMLKDHIAELESKLKEKNVTPERKKEKAPVPAAAKASAPKAAPTRSISKLTPPKIVIPTLGQLKKEVQQKASESAKGKVEIVKMPDIEPQKVIDVPIPKEEPAITPVPIKKPSISVVSDKKPKITLVTEEKPKISPVSDKKPKITLVTEEKPKIAPVSDKKPIIAPVSDEKPKISPVSDEKPKISPVSDEKPKISPVSDEKPKITPMSEEKPKISPVSLVAAEESKKEPVIAPINLSEATSVKKKGKDIKLDKVSSSTKLFNVFSAGSGTETKGKPDKGGKRRRGDSPGGSAASSGFMPSSGSEDFARGDSQMAAMAPKDKEKLYQELIAFEGRRYSIEKSQKNLENRYEKGQLDEFEYRQEMDKIKDQFGEITANINQIRKIIQSL